MPTTEQAGRSFYWTNELPGSRVVVFLGDMSNFASWDVLGSFGRAIAVALSRWCFRCMNKGLDGVVGSAESVGGEQAGCLQ